MDSLTVPHGGQLKNLYVSGDVLEQQKEKAKQNISWCLTKRQLCDIELFVGDGQNGTMGTTSTDIDLTWQVMIPVQLQSSCD